MSALLWKYAVLLITVFTVLSASPRLLPVTEVDLSAFEELFFTSTACPDTPCLLGIQPQATSLRDAIRILNRSHWASLIQNDEDMNQREVEITWVWSNRQPDFIDSSIRGRLIARRFPGSDNFRITGVFVAVHLPAEAYRHLLPIAETAAPYSTEANSYLLSYPNLSSSTQTTIAMHLGCPPPAQSRWHIRAAILQGGVHFLDKEALLSPARYC